MWTGLNLLSHLIMNQNLALICVTAYSVLLYWSQVGPRLRHQHTETAAKGSVLRCLDW